MIVRDDADALRRCLGSVLGQGLADAWTVCDTGSTDGTREVAVELLGHLPGRLVGHRWRDFGHNRTLALRAARGTARWLLLLDSDMTVEAHPGLRGWLAGDPDPSVDAWMVEVRDSGLRYRLPLLVRGDAEARYVGATHEYLDVGRTRPLTGLVVEHHGDGSSRDEKLERDLALLQPGVEAGDERSTFYAAETLRYLGRADEAALLYRRRAAMGGWEEEAWNAAYREAELRGDVEGLIEAWRRRPWRHEPLTAAARIAARDERAAGDVLFLERLPA